ncbi:MAG: hypothetical protein WC506_02275 [Candidatus Micrarchaeia archaeon]
MTNLLEETLDRQWHAACKLVFGREIGSLANYKKWLCTYSEPTMRVESGTGGGSVTMGNANYPPGARFEPLSAMHFSGRGEALSINDIKDIDSIARAASEKFAYCGDIVLGNSSNVSESSNVADSHCILGSSIVNDSKYAAYSHKIRTNESTFGSNTDAFSKYSVMCVAGHKNNRAFEAHFSYVCSDCYYTSRVQNCSDCMFCFGIENMRNRIGNIALEKGKYAQLKSKLMSEAADILEQKGRIFSLLDIISIAAGEGKEAKARPVQSKPQKPSSGVERAFRDTAKLLLGRELDGGVDSYSAYLGSCVPQNKRIGSALTGKPTFFAGFVSNAYAPFRGIARRMVSQQEMFEIVGSRKAEAASVGKLSMDAESAAGLLNCLCYVTTSSSKGTLVRVTESAGVIDSSDCHAGNSYVLSKKCAYSAWPRESECIFGSNTVWQSSYCMKAFFSKKITRCMEVDNCESCSGLYFSHNCENVHDSMFCFNAKNLRHAIGNLSLGREKYLKARQGIISQAADELSRHKNLKTGIFSLGGKA